MELLRLGRDQLAQYSSVELRAVEVIDAHKQEQHFQAILGDGTHVSARKMLLATGVSDQLPNIEGLRPLYGISVFHCPYCDGWELRDQPLATYGRGASGWGLTIAVTIWSKDLVFCSDGPADLDEEQRLKLDELEVPIREERIVRLEGTDGILERIVFQSGEPLERRAMFVHTSQGQASCLPSVLGCEDKERRSVPTGKYEVTRVPGLYAAGDTSRDVQWAIVAAAEGAEAAFAINKALLEESLREGSLTQSALLRARG
jgi:thioredoxin reductase